MYDDSPKMDCARILLIVSFILSLLILGTAISIWIDYSEMMGEFHEQQTQVYIKSQEQQ